MKNTNVILLPKVLKNLSLLGENIKLARLRRGIPMRLICDRAHISRPTLMKIEQGSPDVSLGLYASVLNALGNHDDDLSHILEVDELGRNIQDVTMKEWRKVKR